MSEKWLPVEERTRNEGRTDEDYILWLCASFDYVGEDRTRLPIFGDFPVETMGQVEKYVQVVGNDALVSFEKGLDSGHLRDLIFLSRTMNDLTSTGNVKAINTISKA
jgi:hypothetical protein